MKKIVLFVVALVMSVTASAQFEEGKGYLGASLSGLDISSQQKQFHLGLNAKAGYLFMDNLMALGVVEFNSQKNFDILTTQIGAGARYYFESCGIYLGALAKYAHVKDKTSDLGISFSDFRPEAHVGYCFFLGRHVTLDPEVYYEHSFKNSDYSGFGLRIGIGIYF